MLISNKPNFSFINEELESISDFSKKKTQIFDFGIWNMYVFNISVKISFSSKSFIIFKL